jgi:hypothetical protein
LTPSFSWANQRRRIYKMNEEEQALLLSKELKNNYDVNELSHLLPKEWNSLSRRTKN